MTDYAVLSNNKHNAMYTFKRTCDVLTKLGINFKRSRAFMTITSDDFKLTFDSENDWFGKSKNNGFRGHVISDTLFKQHLRKMTGEKI